MTCCMPGVTVTLPTICLVVDEVGEVANNEECSYDSNIFCKRNLKVTNSIVFEILAMQARIQGLAATAVLIQHWSEEVIHILHLSHTLCALLVNAGCVRHNGRPSFWNVCNPWDTSSIQKCYNILARGRLKSIVLGSRRWMNSTSRGSQLLLGFAGNESH